jgi:hypothetical protein
MLKWFDQHPSGYWIIASVTTSVILIVLLLGLIKGKGEASRGPDWRWGIVILALLCVGRWPSWFHPRQMNEDEGFLIAGAMALRHDPIYFRAVDGGTAGPLDFYALLPVGTIHGADDYFSARVTAALLIATALIFAHQTLAVVCGRHVARIATFSGTFFEAFTLAEDFLHYSTELLPIALLSFACWAGTHRFMNNAGRIWPIAGGLALGLIPFAKLQAAPAALMLGLVWVGTEIWIGRKAVRNCRGIVVGMCAAALAPLALAALTLTITGQWRNTTIPYVLNNLSYLGDLRGSTHIMISSLWLFTAYPGALFGYWAVGCCSWFLVTLPFMRTGSKPTQFWSWTSIGFLIVSVVSVLAPRRDFAHYTQLLVVPGTLVLGVITGMIIEPLREKIFLRCGMLCLALACTTGLEIVKRVVVTNPYVESLEQFELCPRGEVAEELLKYAKPGESLSVWGWRNSCYAESGLRQATRSAVTIYEAQEGKFQAFFQKRFLIDFDHSKPPVFVDSVGEKNPYASEPKWAHEQSFPALAAIIHRDYTQVAVTDGARIFVRNDRLAQIASSAAQK